MWVTRLVVGRKQPEVGHGRRVDLAACPPELEQFQERTSGDSNELAQTQYRGRPGIVTNQLVGGGPTDAQDGCSSDNVNDRRKALCAGDGHGVRDSAHRRRPDASDHPLYRRRPQLAIDALGSGADA